MCGVSVLCVVCVGEFCVWCVFFSMGCVIFVYMYMCDVVCVYCCISVRPVGSFECILEVCVFVCVCVCVCVCER